MGVRAVDLVVRIDGQERYLAPGEALTVGRGGSSDWVLNDLRVSRRHLSVYWKEGWNLEDLASANGTFLAGVEIKELPINDANPLCALRLGDPVDGPLVELALQGLEEGALHEAADSFLTTRVVDAGDGRTVSVGRDPSATIAVADPLVSRQHCKILERGMSLVVVDLGSRNGTYVNGSQVHECVLSPGDTLTVGNTDIDVDQSHCLVVRSNATRTGLVLRNLSYQTPEGKVLISDIDLNAPPGSVIGVIGPSGAGKSTLMNVVAGLRSPAAGSASFEGHDIHIEYSSMKTRIGLVPQEDLIHRQLSARQALGYAAELRLPGDTSTAEVDERVDAVIGLLGLKQHQDTPIKKLSGGQRKRASIGLELLTQPAMLILDEPTSGLDPNTARDLMQTLRGLADAGHTVVVVSHSPADLDQCDLVVLLAAGGLLAGVGTPESILRQFGTPDWRDVYRDVSSEGGDPQAAHTNYLAASADSLVSNPPPPPRRRAQTETSGSVARTRQLGTLVRRQARLLIADRGYLIFLLLLPLALGLLALIVPGHDGFAPEQVDSTSKEATQLLVVLMCGASFAGLALSIRDLVGERSIYERERAVGLRPSAYLGSKVVVLGAAGLVQAALLTAVVLAGKPGPTDPLVLGNGALELFVAVLLTLWSSCALGLLLSSLVRSSEQVMPVLVLAIMVQLVFSGGLIQISGRAVLSQISWIFPSRWGYSAAADTVDIHRISPAVSRDAQWNHDAAQWVNSCLMLIVLSVVFLLLAVWRISESGERAVKKRRRES